MADSNQQPEQQPQESVTINVSSNDPQARSQEPPVSSRFVSNVNRFKEHLLDRPIRYDILSIMFTILVFVGGLVGYLTKDSWVSLVAGTIFAFLLAASTYLEGARKNPYPLLVTLLALLGIMVYRYVQKFNFMPAGFIGLLTLIMIARHCYLIYLKKKQPLPTAAEAPQAEEAAASQPTESG